MSENGNGHHGNSNGHQNGRLGQDGWPIQIPAASSGDLGRLPPQNIEAERALLGGLLIDNAKFVPVLSIPLASEHFYRNTHQMLFRAMADLYLRGSPVDAVSVSEELKARNQFDLMGRHDFLLEITNAAVHGESCEYHAAVIIEKWRLREYIQANAEAIRNAYDGCQPSTDLLEAQNRRLAQIEWHTDADAELLGQVRPWPDPLAKEALYGVAGEIVRLIEPHTEADPAAILMQLLAGLGNLVGRRPHWRVEATRHHCNLWVCVAGKTSKARKGTSFDHIRWLLERVDPEWSATRYGHGYTSGEGLILDVADDNVKGGQITPGVADKRLFWVESEFGGTLSIMSRDGNTLSAVSRQAWDGGAMAGRSKNFPVRSTDAHISAAFHITVVEANALMSSTNAANGFGNRILWVCAQRSKILPHGGQIHTVDFAPMLRELTAVMDFVKYELDPSIPVMRHKEANTIWEAVYPGLSSGKPGLLGAMTSRAEAQVMRLATLYAVLDRDKYIRPCHLNAALACWTYCEQSARFIFGDRMGDPDVERLLKGLQPAGPEGLSRTEIRRKTFGAHKSPTELDEILSRAIQAGLIEPVPVEAPAGGGRQRACWRIKQEEQKIVAPAPFAPFAPIDRSVDGTRDRVPF